MINLFITGMLRSGTTLLEKALNTHPDVKIFYQPFPEFFIHTKQQFLKDKGLDPAYHVLSHFCDTADYSPSDFSAWLDRGRLSRTFLTRVLSPAATPSLDESVPPERLFHQWYSFLTEQLSSSKHIRCTGTKEVLTEEYIPHLISHHIRCAIVVRDPRDVIASLDFGSGREYGGDNRPTLFNLRNWRKSILFALAMGKSENFYLIRFEDLVLNPIETLDKLANKLSIPPFHEEWWANGFRDKNGSIWKGNSSFGDIKPFDSGAVGGHRRKLPEDTIKYIEARCRREMMAMGYHVSPSSISESKKRITEFKEPFRINRPEFSPDYSSLAENVAFETSRLEHPDKDSFLFQKAADALLCVDPWN